MESYPNCAHLSSLQDELQATREFYTFLQNEGYFICKHVNYEDDEDDESAFVPIGIGMTDLFYKMHSISPTELEHERGRILELQREANEG